MGLAEDIMGVMSSNVPDIAGWLDTTYPPLNKMITGDPKRGLPYGRIVEIFGPSGSGKSWLATQLMINAQKSGGFAFMHDHEYALNLEYAVRQGLNKTAPYWGYARPKTLEASMDMACAIVEKVRKAKEVDPLAPIVYVFDSIHAMVPKEKFDKVEEKSLEELNMRDKLALASALSASMPMVNQVSAELNACFLFLNQIRTKPGVVYGNPITTPGGATMEFYASVRLSLGRKLVKEGTGDEKETTGQTIGIQTAKNRFSRPFQELDVLLRFNDEVGSEFDRVSSLLGELISSGKVAYSKPRATWLDGKQYFVKQLVDKIKEEGLYEELVKLYVS